MSDCPYKWWGAYQKFQSTACESKLILLAKRVLSAAPSSVMSERLFSVTGNIYEARRSRLLPEHGEQIAFLNFNMKRFL